MKNGQFPPIQSDRFKTSNQISRSLREPDRSIAEYVQELKKAETLLDEFYNGESWRYSSQGFDTERARDEDF